LSDNEPIQCPKCSTTMRHKDFSGITLDICAGCAGLWADPGELASLTGSESNFRSIFGERRETQLPCPRGCPTTLYETSYTNLDRGLLLDGCDRCGGVFLDAGELERVIEVNDRVRELFGEGTFSGAAPGDSGRRVRGFFSRLFRGAGAK
jgi:Zn-finger nucleic acid-binding protein